MKLGLLACDILKPEIESLIKDDPDFVMKEYVDFALHVDPENMRRELLARAENFVGKVDVLVLGYSVCSSLEKVTDVMPLPTVMLPGSDCIEALLGPVEYSAEKMKCAGTWFCTPGWAEVGKAGLIKELHLDCMEGEYDPDFFLEMVFESYSRSLYIDTGVDPDGEYERKARKFAEELKFSHDCRSCNLKNISDTIKRAKELAASMN